MSEHDNDTSASGNGAGPVVEPPVTGGIESGADDAARQLVVESRRTGDPAHAPLYAGEAVGLVTTERSATDVVRDLTADAETALRAVPRLLG